MDAEVSARQALRASIDAAKRRGHAEDSAVPPGDGGDAGLRRITTYVRRLRTAGAATGARLVADAAGLRLGHFVDDAARSLAHAAPASAADYSAILSVAAYFSERYASFAGRIAVHAAAAVDEAQHGTADERRALRTLLELHTIGLAGEAALVSALRRVFAEDDHALLGPASQLATAAAPYYRPDSSAGLVASATRVAVWTHLQSLLSAGACAAEASRSRMRYLHARGRRQYETSASVRPWLAEQITRGHAEYVSLCASVRRLADALGVSPPDVRAEDVPAPRIVDGAIVYVSAVAADPASAFLDEDERAYYEDLLVLPDALPVDVQRRLASIDTPQSPDESLDSVPAADPDLAIESPGVAPDDSTTGQSECAAGWALLSDSLGNMASRDAVDRAACDFAALVAAHPGSTERLQDALAARLIVLPVRRMDLVRPVARLAATLRPLFPGVGASLGRSVLGQFLFLTYRSEALAGSRARVCRMAAELVRARACAAGVALRALQRVIVEAFEGHNVAMGALVLETCGRWLAAQPEAAAPLATLIDVLKRKRALLGLGDAHAAAVDNALAAMAGPGDAAVVAPKAHSLMGGYVRRLVREVLSDSTRDSVLISLCRLPWRDEREDTTSTVAAVLSRPWRVPHTAHGALASVIVGLGDVCQSLVVRVLDALFEAAHLPIGNAHAYPDAAARVYASLRVLAHVYCFGAIAGSALLEALYGVADGPSSSARLRAVCGALTVAAPCLLAEMAAPSCESLSLWAGCAIAPTGLPRPVSMATIDALFRLLCMRGHASAVDVEASFAVRDAMALFSRAPADYLAAARAAAASEQASGRSSATADASEAEAIQRQFAEMVADSVRERKLMRTPGVFDQPIPLSMRSADAPMRILVRKRGTNAGKVVARPLSMD